MTQNYPPNRLPDPPEKSERGNADVHAELAKLQAENSDLKASLAEMRRQMDEMKGMMNPQDIELRGTGMTRVALSQPYMPMRMHDGHMLYPAMQSNPYMQNPEARAFAEYMSDPSRTSERFRARAADIARHRVGQYNYVPCRAQKLPPKLGAIRTRYVRGKGLFKQEYTVTGPDNGWEDRDVMKTYAEVKAEGEARTRAYNEGLAAEQNRYNAAGKTMALWHKLGRGEMTDEYFNRTANFIAYAGKDVDGKQILPGHRPMTGTDVEHAFHVDRAVAEGGIALHSGIEGKGVYIDRPDLPRPTAGGKDRAPNYREYMGIPHPLPKPESKESQKARDVERAHSLVDGLNKALEELHTKFDRPVNERIALEEKTGKKQPRQQQDPDIAQEAVDMINETLTHYDKLKSVLKPSEYEEKRKLMLEQRQEWLEEREQKQVQLIMRALRAGNLEKADELIKKVEDAFPLIHGHEANPMKAFLDNNVFQLDRRDIPYALWVDWNKSKDNHLKLMYIQNKEYKTGRKPGE